MHLLLADAELPGMPGTEAARQLLAGHPKLKVMLMSAGAAQLVLPPEAKAAACLPKPFTVVTLLAGLRALLDGHPGPS